MEILFAYCFVVAKLVDLHWPIMKSQKLYLLLLFSFPFSLDKDQPIQVHRSISCIALCHKLHVSHRIHGLCIQSRVSYFVRRSDSNQILALWYVLSEKETHWHCILSANDLFTNRFIWFFSCFVHKLLDVRWGGKSPKSTHPIRTVGNPTVSIFHSDFTDCFGSILPSNVQRINHIENCTRLWSRTIQRNARSVAQILIDCMHHFLLLHR